MRARRMLWWAALGLGIVCVAPATWWSSGGNRGEADPGMDYLWRPPDISTNVGHAVGVLAMTSVACSALLLAFGVRSGAIPSTLVKVVVPLALIGVYVGFTYNVATAPVIGANIGAGMLLFLGIPVLVGLNAWAIIAVDRYRRRSRSAHSRSGDR